MQFAENVGAHVVRLKGSSVPAVTADYIAKNRITQVIFGRSAVKGWRKYLYYIALQRFMSGAWQVDVHIVTQPEEARKTVVRCRFYVVRCDALDGAR